MSRWRVSVSCDTSKGASSGSGSSVEGLSSLSSTAVGVESFRGIFSYGRPVERRFFPFQRDFGDGRALYRLLDPLAIGVRLGWRVMYEEAVLMQILGIGDAMILKMVRTAQVLARHSNNWY